MAKTKSSHIGAAIFALLSSLILLVVVVYQPVVSHNPSDYYRLPVRLAVRPEHYVPSEGSAEWHFSFTEWPNVRFAVQCSHTADSAIDRLHAGDSATIVVMKEEYRRRLLGKANLFERLVTGRVQLFGLVYNGHNYVRFTQVTDSYMSPWLTYPILLLFIVAMGYQGIAVLWRAWLRPKGYKNNGTHSL